MELIHKIEIYFLLFMTYAFLGWIMEVSCKLIQEKRFINRGFLIGPYCPIYGWGGVIITILLNRYIADPVALFVMSVVICSIIEYGTSYFMEKRYHARWWDYSNKKFNINGRICLETLIPFGILGLVIMYVVNPPLIYVYQSLSNIVLHSIAITLAVIFITDNIISSHIMAAIQVEGAKERRDNTEELTNRVKQILREKSLLHRRLMNAFPNVKDIRVKIKQKVDINKTK